MAALLPLQALSCCPFRLRDVETVTRENIFKVTQQWFVWLVKP